jgi:hypothetical protein
MKRIAVLIVVLLIGGTALAAAASWSVPENGGDAATDRIDPDDAPVRFTPVPVDDDDARTLRPRTSTDPGLDTGSAARVDGGWI